jgi:hypothetical protein
LKTNPTAPSLYAGDDCEMKTLNVAQTVDDWESVTNELFSRIANVFGVPVGQLRNNSRLKASIVSGNSTLNSITQEWHRTLEPWLLDMIHIANGKKLQESIGEKFKPTTGTLSEQLKQERLHNETLETQGIGVRFNTLAILEPEHVLLLYDTGVITEVTYKRLMLNIAGLPVSLINNKPNSDKRLLLEGPTSEPKRQKIAKNPTSDSELRKDVKKQAKQED